MSRRPTNHFIPVSDQEMFHLSIFFLKHRSFYNHDYSESLSLMNEPHEYNDGFS